MKDTYGKTSTGMTKFTKGMSKGFNKAGANLSRMGSNLISSNKKKNDVSIFLGVAFVFVTFLWKRFQNIDQDYYEV